MKTNKQTYWCRGGLLNGEVVPLSVKSRPFTFTVLDSRSDLKGEERERLWHVNEIRDSKGRRSFCSDDFLAMCV